MNKITKIIISLIAISIAVAHVFLPSVKIDVIVLSLLALAALPWFLPYLDNFEIPGVVKISLRKAKAATDKLGQDKIVKLPSAQLKITPYPPEIKVAPAVITEQELLESTFDHLRRISETEPNLALVGFRIEIEKRIVKLAQMFELKTERIGLSKLVRELAKNEIITKDAASGLAELITLGNQAAHGADVTREAADWVLNEGPSILWRLEDTGSPKNSEGNNAPNEV